MATGRANTISWQLCLAAAASRHGPSDAQLLERYITCREEAAFEVLLRRHGPMVLGVCRRLLGDRQEAQDAFQATFLVLVQKADSVQPREMLPGWLHGVARQTAIRARSLVARRRFRERPLTEQNDIAACPSDPGDDLRAILDQEISRLPGHHRAAVVACDLEGLTHKEAARRLGWPVGTLASRHSRARKTLAKRLARRGLAPPDFTPAAALSSNGSAPVPALLFSATAQAASYRAYGTMASPALSQTVVLLMEGVLKVMFLEKVQMIGSAALLAGIVLLGGGLFARHTAAADRRDVAADRKPQPVGKDQQAPPPAPANNARKSILEVQADGKGVLVRAEFGEDRIQASATRMTYDEESKVLTLEGEVKVKRRYGKVVEEMDCKRMKIDRRMGSVSIEGAGAIRQQLGTRGPVPLAIDFAFPVVRGIPDAGQAFSFYIGFAR